MEENPDAVRAKNRATAKRTQINHPEKVTAKRRKDHLSKYGMTEASFNAMLKHQKNRCAACQTPFKGSRDINIDHCHNTNVVRGLLCSACNWSEGRLKTPENVLKLYHYMLKNELFYPCKN
jgi:Recombination endonuclease VII